MIALPVSKRDQHPFPPIPNGWFAVAWSNEIKAGGVRTLHYFGRELVLFRSHAGVASVLDAHCPHLGAHLGIGGRVYGETLACPFHGWRFDGQGQCQKIPYATRIPTRACLRAWPTAEANGVIQVYYDAADRAPAAPPAAFAQFGQPGWHQFPRKEFPLRSHPQELMENAFDLAHFPVVHHTVAPTVVAHQQDGSTMSIQLVVKPEAAGYPLPITAQIHITAYELGHVIVNVRIPPLGSIHVLQYATPVADEHMHVRQIYLGELGRDILWPLRWLGHSVIRLESLRQTRTDRPILNHRIYRPIPTLCAEDRLIATFRKWAKGFYAPKESPAAVSD